MYTYKAACSNNISQSSYKKYTILQAWQYYSEEMAAKWSEIYKKIVQLEEKDVHILDNFWHNHFFYKQFSWRWKTNGYKLLHSVTIQGWYVPNAFENIMHPSLHQISTTNASKLC